MWPAGCGDRMYPLRVMQAASRHRRLFLMLFVLYLALDFADPAMPGLLNFTIGFNREAVQARASAEIEEPALALVALPHRKAIPAESPSPRRISARAGACFFGDWLVTLRLSHQPSPASSDPDH